MDNETELSRMASRHVRNLLKMKNREDMFLRVTKEPFRIFFLCGLMAGFAGVLLWPLYHFGAITSIKRLLHARLQIEGFLGSFVTGFLMTALPRLLSAPPCTRWELGVFILTFASMTACHICGMHSMGDLIFGFQIVLLLFYGWKRFSVRQDLPPPFFVFVPIGFLHALTGIIIIMCADLNLGSRFLVAGHHMLNVGFILCLILGIGSFLGPRFFGVAQALPVFESRNPSKEWIQRVVCFGVAGLMIYLSFWIESIWPQTALLLRAIVVSGVLLRQIPIYRSPQSVGCLPHAMRLALFSVLLGVWGMALFSRWQVSMLHILFIGGFSLTTLVVATRVIFGHSGWEHLFQTRMFFLGVVTLLMGVALVIRVVADHFSDSYYLLLSLASLAWLAAGTLWAIVVLPKLLFPRPETDE